MAVLGNSLILFQVKINVGMKFTSRQNTHYGLKGMRKDFDKVKIRNIIICGMISDHIHDFYAHFPHYTSLLNE